MLVIVCDQAITIAIALSIQRLVLPKDPDGHYPTRIVCC